MPASSTTMTTLKIVETSRAAAKPLESKSDVTLSDQPSSAGISLSVQPDEVFQKIEGFGGAFTEAGADTLSRMSKAKRDEVLNAYFHPETGSRYTLCRTHINSCDFALGNYAYSDVPGDYELEKFDIAHDHKLLIPFIKDAMVTSNDGFRLFASPWSPPAWMKTNGEMNNGGSLKRDCLETWALYFSKYIKAYAEEGIDIWGVTVQNEPDAKQTWDSCKYTEEEERDFVKYYLGPRLLADGLGDVKIIVWDHNKDIIYQRADMILSDPDAAKFVWGVGFHWYTGDHFDQLDKIHKKYPDTKLIFTEGCQEGGVKLGSWELGERYAHAMIGDINNWCVGWVDWNMVLDERGGPNHVGNYCDAPIICDTKTDTIHYQNAYYYIGHFSRYVQPGARRIGISSGSKELEATAFKNPDGSIVVVALNRTENPIEYALSIGDQSAAITIPARGMQTLTV